MASEFVDLNEVVRIFKDETGVPLTRGMLSRIPDGALPRVRVGRNYVAARADLELMIRATLDRLRRREHVAFTHGRAEWLVRGVEALREGSD